MNKKFAEYSKFDLSDVNKEVLKKWQDGDVFHKSLKIREGHPSFVFYEGPPSANGMPGIHHESIEITPWFYLYFTENPGMAFGIEVIGKLFLSIFRIVAVIFIGYYLFKLVKQNYGFGFIACISLIFAGAIGNIIDSIFYGVIFNDSVGQLATFMPDGGGYAGWLHGISL